MKGAILFPLPDRDFDLTEVAIPYTLLSRAGHRVVFATEHGATPQADPLLISGLPFGLGAAADAIAHYRALEQTEAFRNPVAWTKLDPHDYAGLFLAGGHAPGMRQYLGASLLQHFVARFWTLERPVAAICHGVLVLARSRDLGTGRSLIRERRVTCLPKYMERTAFLLTAWKLGRYYRTYPECVQDEVVSALADPAQFERGPISLVARGSEQDDGPAYVVTDGRLVTARWPGDAYLVSKAFMALLDGATDSATASATNSASESVGR